MLTSSHERIFSAGGDLKAFSDDRTAEEKHRGLDRFPRLYTLIGELGKPVICAANGDVLAGAFGVALACDLIIAKETARFGCPEINVGVFPFMISALIYRNVPRMAANELMMFGDLIPAAEAHRLGIVNRVVADADFDAETLAWAERLATKSPLLMAMGKDALAASRDLAAARGPGVAAWPTRPRLHDRRHEGGSRRLPGQARPGVAAALAGRDERGRRDHAALPHRAHRFHRRGLVVHSGHDGLDPERLPEREAARRSAPRTAARSRLPPSPTRPRRRRPPAAGPSR